MALMRGFSRVDEGGRIAIPANIRREVGIKTGQLVEIKITGPVQAQYLCIRKRAIVR